MRGYAAIFRLRTIVGLQYRTAAFAGILTQFFWGGMVIMVLEAFYASSPGLQPMTLDQAAAYIWLRQAFLVFIVLWIRDGEISESIVSGNVAYELCRPYGLYGYWFAKGMAYRLAGGVLRCWPVLLAAFLLPHPYRLALPADRLSGMLFVVSMLLSLFIAVAITMIMYTSMFATLTPWGSIAIFSAVNDFLAGGVVPLPLMPSWLQTIAYRLPFYATQDTPFRIYTGHLPHDLALLAIGQQLLWLVGLILLGNFLLAKSVRRVVIQGG